MSCPPRNRQRRSPSFSPGAAGPSTRRPIIDALFELERLEACAARVASQALGGEVVVSSLVRELVSGSGFELRESREVELKGLDGTHRLFAVDLRD
jgi:hypothetical protein